MEQGSDPFDMFTHMWGLQKALQERLNPHDPHVDTRDLTALPDWQKAIVEEAIQRHTLCLIMEGAELMDWTRWKHWSMRLGNKKDLDFFGPEHVKEIRMEIIDLFHFLLNLAIVTGMDPESFFRLYLEKNGVNHNRQDTGTY